MSVRTLIQIAQELIGSHGARAAAMALDLARDIAHAGDAEAAEFWYQVAAVTEALLDDQAASGHAAARPPAA